MTLQNFLSRIHWQILPYQSVEKEQLYNCLRLRSDVFVVEQGCMYADLDGKDQDSWHVFGTYEGALIAYARLLPAGVSYTEVSIGRVVTHASYRKHRLGTALMQQCMEWIILNWPNTAIKISAQHHLLAFYSTFGFEPVGEVYDDAGIPHIAMLRPSIKAE